MIKINRTKYFFKKNFLELSKLLQINNRLKLKLEECAKLFIECNNLNNKIIFIGNGGSAAISSHVSVDLTKNAGIKSVNFNDADLITCFANDFGHKNWMKMALKMYANKGDIVVLISTSGESYNIIEAAKWTTDNEIKLVTFSGKKKTNRLNKFNKNNLNFWVDSNAYNHVELIHLALLLSIIDYIIGTSVYKA